MAWRGRSARVRLRSAPMPVRSMRSTSFRFLTAIAAAAAAAHDHRDDVDACLAAAVEGAREAVARTPELLPVLKEAGVVDSGAQGLYVLLDGMLRGLRGEDLAPPEDVGAIDAGYFEATSTMHGSEGSGFCTEFVIEATAIDVSAVRRELRSMGESVL